MSSERLLGKPTTTEAQPPDLRSKEFWKHWQENQERLFRCCLKWMGNLTDAEDALSRAMLKAWEKAQQYAEKITNFPAWLSKLTYNLCVDIHRERDRGANPVENIEAVSVELREFVENTPEKALDNEEKKQVIGRAIDKLPLKMRETFILHFYEELSHQEIAKQQEISYHNVCQRISQARKILRKELKGYFIGEEDTETASESASTVTPAVPDSAIEEMFEGNAGVEAIADETTRLSLSVEEMESLSSVELPQEGDDIQHSDSVIVGATSQGTLEVSTEDCQSFKDLSNERQLVLMLSLAQLEKKTGDWSNFAFPVLWKQEQHLVEKVAKVAVKNVRASRSPPLNAIPYFSCPLKNLWA